MTKANKARNPQGAFVTAEAAMGHFNMSRNGINQLAKESGVFSRLGKEQDTTSKKWNST